MASGNGLNFSTFSCPHCDKIIATHVLGSASVGTSFRRGVLGVVIISFLIVCAFLPILVFGWTLLETLGLVTMLFLAYTLAHAYHLYRLLSLHFPPRVFLFVHGPWLYFDLKGLPIGPNAGLCQESVKYVRLEEVQSIRIRDNYFTIELTSRHALDTFFAKETLNFVLEQLLPYLPDSVPVTLNAKPYQSSPSIKTRREQLALSPKIAIDPLPLRPAPWGIIQWCGVLLMAILCVFLAWAVGSVTL